jgi:LysM repeat protein
MSTRQQEEYKMIPKRKDKKRIIQPSSIDPLNLPPRSTSIKNKEDERRPWWKLKYPLLTALVFIFILLPIGVVTLVQYKYEGIFSSKGIFIPSDKFEKVKITSTPETTENENENSTLKPNPNPYEHIKNNISKAQVVTNEKIHVVKSGETLFTISMKYYGDRNGELIIQEANNLSDINVKPGQNLKIPLNVDVNK